MHPSFQERLLAINKEFYQSFASSFAATRRRIQPGIRRVLAGLPGGGDWLDLGCGSGALAAEWQKMEQGGSYIGLDFSPGLLMEAKENLPNNSSSHSASIRFLQVDLSQVGWDSTFTPGSFDGVLAFAVLHHLPGHALRLEVLQHVHALLKTGGMFVHSEWQFQNSPRLLARILPWRSIGVDPNELEEGDTLLDWRHPQPGESAAGLRYVHLFNRQELALLAKDGGFAINTEFESDGAGGKLGLYQTWVKQ